ncbi:MAG: ComEA family DNA-binding protein [Candidatus Egerieousia sp.]
MRKGENRRTAIRDEGEISNSKALGVITLIAILLVFQIATFTLHKCERTTERETKVSEDAAEQGRNMKADTERKYMKESAYNPQKDYGSYQNNAGNKYSNYNRGRKLIERFIFDPNTITSDSLQALGLSEKQALTIIHYREKGGRFKRAEDFKKMYVIGEKLYAELEPYIKIRSGTDKYDKSVERRPVLFREMGNELSKLKKDSICGRTAYSRKEIQPIDLNEADSAELVSIKGIGPYFAREILRYRSKLTSYASIEQLLEIPKMSEDRLAPLRKYLFVHPSGIKKFSIAAADYDFLKRHPYIGAYTARGILLFKEQYGADSCTLEKLVSNGVVSKSSADKLLPYMR